jgi:hypothetical protein
MGYQSDFLERVLQRVPDPQAIKGYYFQHWSVPGKVTEEVLGFLEVPGADPQKIMERVMDVDNYPGNIAQVQEFRSIPDSEYQRPDKVRAYLRIKIPILGAVHQEIVVHRIGQLKEYEIAYWFMLDRETSALEAKSAARSEFNDGAWLVAPGIVGYALSSCPKREDVGFLKWKALTTGADAAAYKFIRDNIENIVQWAER